MNENQNQYGKDDSPLMALIRRRYSCRNFTPSIISDDELYSVIEAARMAPSANNEQPWHFIAVRERSMIQHIVNEAQGAPVPNKFLLDCSCILVLCIARPLLSATNIGGRLRDVPYDSLDLGIAGEHLCLRATELGLATIWIGWFKEDILKKLLNIPKRARVVALIGLGRAAVPGKPRPRKKIEEILSREKWKNS